MLENVRGILDKVFDDYRANIVSDLKKLRLRCRLALAQCQ